MLPQAAAKILIPGFSLTVEGHQARYNRRADLTTKGSNSNIVMMMMMGSGSTLYNLEKIFSDPPAPQTKDRMRIFPRILC